jgi:hypothetical protein
MPLTEYVVEAVFKATFAYVLGALHFALRSFSHMRARVQIRGVGCVHHAPRVALACPIQTAAPLGSQCAAHHRTLHLPANSAGYFCPYFI